MNSARTSKAHEIAAQQKWIREHGETLSGYVARYGSKDDASHYGNGGEAIFAADLAELHRLESAAA